MPHSTSAPSDAFEAFDILLATWRAAFNQRDLERLAGLFAEDALFQGLTPNLLVGRGAIAAYYADVPAGVDADVQSVKARPLAEEAMAGFATVVFTMPEPAEPRPVRISMVAKRDGDEWRIRLYHASAMTEPPPGG